MKEKDLSEIRKIAYGLWEQEGRPDGQDRRHWDTAKEIWAFRHSGEDAPQSQQREPGEAKGLPGHAKAAQKPGRGGQSLRSGR
ncbi:MAG TPA: DUF2934 domain-containing protein [Bosea sp. (in: a-proteobacteria)]|jgi:hypothetical protein|uniref:DUF2934 domain-containing protein n=1 Tax=Bosea sp. (in: a-proteobacteria) TaxID=1871050 RepID=UPI002E132A6D|nr:DUF2934 domain-containing protein [Bosea sp. (in: a-proteobacteria)]